MRISSSRMAQMLENTGAAALQLTPEELGGAEFRRARHQGAVRGFPRLLRSCQGSKLLLKCDDDALFPGRAQGCLAIREPAGKLRISHMRGVPLPARRRTVSIFTHI
jgi:hypothetical protein